MKGLTPFHPTPLTEAAHAAAPPGFLAASKISSPYVWIDNGVQKALAHSRVRRSAASLFFNFLRATQRSDLNGRTMLHIDGSLGGKRAPCTAASFSPACAEKHLQFWLNKDWRFRTAFLRRRA